jgi:flagellar motor switch protein FliG
VVDTLQPTGSQLPATLSDNLPATLSKSQKAAAVLLSVGPDVASSVLQYLPEHEVEKVALEIATLGDVAPTDMEGVLQEFKQEAIAHAHLISGGERQARDLLRQWCGDEADEIVDRLLATVRTTPFHFLRLHEPHEVCQHLRDEHPQTIALVLAHLPTKFAAQILAGFDAEVQGEIALRVATMDRTSPEVVERVEAALHHRFGPSARRNARTEQGGVRELASMLNNADRATERAILSSLEAVTPELAEEVRALMFVFEDIVTLDDRTLQEVLRQVDPKRLALAMKGVRQDVNGVILRNLSERAREALVEEIELLGPSRIRDVEAAQSEVVRLIRRLEEAGTVIINRGGDGELVE